MQVLLLLWCAAAAAAARYADYSGVRMPAYGGASDYDAPREPGAAPASDDYRGHSPDAPASPDYKYEEEPRIKTEKPTKDSDDPEVWRKPGRKQRGLIRPVDSASADVASKYERDEEDVPKFRLSHHYPKHRSRLKGAAPARDEESPPRRAAKYSRDRKDDVSDIDRKDYFHVDKDDFSDDKSKDFEEDVKFVEETTSRRGKRRKPRDRHVKRKESDLGSPYDDESELERHPLEEPEPRRTRPTDMRPLLGARGHDRFHAPLMSEDDEELTKVQPLNKNKPKTYDDYDDYYDMKRVNSIKNKLPSLLRRTTERAPSSSQNRLWGYRRKYPPVPEREQDEPERTELLPNRRLLVPTTTTVRPSKTSSASPTTSTATVTQAGATSTTLPTTTPNATVLSFAEKSRLSILKKDQRKEGLHFDPTTKKPPVLLQVTRYMPTVVMVEPPSSMHPWMRARELSEDSPERIEKVKKMMRHKLVAEAKSIHDLTNNWEDLVCDYVDVALLDSNAAAVRVPCDVLSVWLVLYVCVLI